MTHRILMVDDEVRVLDGLRRNLHGRWHIDAATSGADGLALIAAAKSPYAVVVSDMMMPAMNGAEFLTRAHHASPDTVQMILSGQAELTSTIAAVNDGNLFRFLTKPCEAANLGRAIDAALAQYQLVESERELLERTLDGAVEVLTELIAATHPVVANRTETVKALIDAVAADVRLDSTWELRIAAMLGQVGLIAVPDGIAALIHEGGPVSDESKEIYRGHPRLAYDLIRRIPRLERVAAWVGTQPVSFDDATDPAPAPLPGVASEPEPAEPGGALTGRDVYAAVVAFVVGVEGGRAPATVIGELARTGRYSQPLLDATGHAYSQTKVRSHRQVGGSRLMVGMQLNQDVITTTGLILVRTGEVLTESMAIRLRHFADNVGVVEPINVLV